MASPADVDNDVTWVSFDDVDDNEKDDFGHEDMDTLEMEYVKVCKSLKVPIVTPFLKHVSSDNLKLAHRGIGDKAIKGIAKCLKRNTELIGIGFTDNCISTRGAILVGNIFKVNYFIKQLNLSCNKIGNDGLMSLLTSTEQSDDLQYLNVSDNQITDKAAEAICRFMIHNDGV